MTYKRPSSAGAHAYLHQMIITTACVTIMAMLWRDQGSQ